MKRFFILLLCGAAASMPFRSASAQTTSLQVTPLTPQQAAASPFLRPHYRNRFGICCDSWEQQSSNQTDLTNPQLTAANLPLLNSMLGLPWYFDPANDNFGQSGGDLPNFFSQLPAILARHDDYFVLGVGHNAFIGQITATLNAGGNQAAAIAAAQAYLTTEENMFTTAASDLVANGTIPVVVLENSLNCDEVNVTQLNGCYTSPYSTTYLPTVQNLILAFNVWKRDFAMRTGYPIWDWWTPTAPASGVSIGGSTYMGVCSSCSDDYIHENNYGNWLIANRGTTDLASLSGPSVAPLVATTLDAYNATTNPYGNMINSSYGMMLGGTYAYTTTPFAGNFANGWTGLSASVGTGKIITGSVSAAASGVGNAVTFAISGTGTAGNSNLEYFSTNTQLALGGSGGAATVTMTIACWGVINAAANSPFTKLAFTLGTSGGNQSNGNTWGGNIAGIVSGVNAAGVSYASAKTYTVAIPPITVQSGQTASLYVNPAWNDISGSFAGTFSISQMTCRQVPPNVAF